MIFYLVGCFISWLLLLNAKDKIKDAIDESGNSSKDLLIPVMILFSLLSWLFIIWIIILLIKSINNGKI